MKKILLSINPEHVENIFNGKKEFEFRKNSCKSPVDKIIIYETSPVMRIVGEADILEIIIDNPEIVWEKTYKKAGISKKFYNEYFQNKEKAVAYKLGNVKKYDKPLKLSEYGINYAPQSFVYV